MSWAIKDRIALALNPLLLRSAHARLILGIIADYADAEGRCWPSLTTIETRTGGRLDNREIRRARRELLECGLLVETGEAIQRVPVVRVVADALIVVAKGQVVKDAGYDQPRVDVTPGSINPGYYPPRDPRVLSTPGSPGIKGPGEVTIEATNEVARKTEIATGPIEPNASPASTQSEPGPFEEPDPPDPPRGGKWSRPEEMPRDGLLVALAAKRRAKAAALAALPLPGIEAEPEAPPPPKVSPGEARVAAAVVVAMEAIGTAGVPERTLKLWRAKIDTRLRDDGVAEDKVSARLDAIRAAWGNLQRSAWHIENGRADRAHFFKVTLRSGQELDTMASKRAPGRPAPKPWAAVGSAQLLPPTPDPVADAEHAERMAALDRIEQEHLAELERQAIADARAAEAARPKPAPVAPLLPVKVPTETGRGKFARMSEALSLARG